MHMWSEPILAIFFRRFGFIFLKHFLNYLDFQYFDIERTWTLLQKRVVHTMFDIYILLNINNHLSPQALNAKRPRHLTFVIHVMWMKYWHC